MSKTAQPNDLESLKLCFNGIFRLKNKFSMYVGHMIAAPEFKTRGKS